MGFDFVFLLKAHDDLFINPFTLIDQLKSSKTPKSKLYLGNCSPKREYPRREGKWALSYRAVAKILLRSIAYVLSHYLVQAFVGVFDTRSRLKLEDVYMGLLAKSFHVTPRRHSGFMTDSLNRRFFLIVQA